jgi:outer membrane protein assembly factor BamB
MKTRQAHTDAHAATLRGLRALFAAACLSAPVAAAQLSFAVDVAPTAPTPATTTTDPAKPAELKDVKETKEPGNVKPAPPALGGAGRGIGAQPRIAPLPAVPAAPGVPPIAPPAVAPAAGAKPAAAAPTVPAAPAEKVEPVDAVLEKEIEKLKKELEGLTKGKTDYDLKAAELKRKEGELARKTLAAQRKRQQEELNSQIAGGATLDTDSEVDMLLDRAREYAGETRFREACVLWQHVLDNKSGLTDRQPSLSALKGQPTSAAVLRPVRDLVELELSALPPDGLNEYRLTADPEAAAVIAERGDLDPAGLADVVRRFFLSSYGDDAAFRLACIKMDEMDFISARRLLEKVTRHPTPSVPRGELLLRLALASAKAGDGAGARESLQHLQEVTLKNPLPEGLFATIVRVVEAGPAILAATGPVAGWPMALGGAARDGIMGGAPGKPVAGDALWIDQQVADFDYKIPDLAGKNQMMGQPQQGPQPRQEIVTRWEKGGWTPTAQVVLQGRKAFFKTHNELRWYDIDTRKLVGSVGQEPLKLDPNARIWPQTYYYGQQKPDSPSSSEEVAMFGDRVAKSMTLVGDTLFHIENRMWTSGPYTRIMVWANNKQSTLQMTERLCAVDIRDGVKGDRVKWRYPAEADGQTDLRFVAAPVPSGDRLLVPVMRNAELHLIGLDLATGKELWSTLLCMPNTDDGARWAPVGVSVVGSEAYVASGYGVVFAADAHTGSILWATRYKRSEPAGPQQAQMIFTGQRQVALTGWSEDVVIPRGDKLVVLASDSDQVLCFSRLSGKQLWTSTREKATYALGVLNDSLYVAGKNVIRRYGIHNGKIEKELVFKFDSHARGALTPQGVYLPTKTEIVRLDPTDFKTLGKLRIATGSRDPVGNLFCDGNHLVAAGLDRVYALSDGELKMKELTDSIAAKDSGALRVERAFLHHVVGKTGAAVEDLRVAVKLLPAGKERDEASRKLMLGLLDLAKASPDGAVALFEEAEKAAEPLKQQVRIWLARGRYHAGKNEAGAALDLFLKAAQDTSDALVLVDDEDGRRETRASLAAGAEIRVLVQKLPALSDELARRGEAALKPHMDLAALERLAQGNANLPQAAEVQTLETELARLDIQHREAQKKAMPLLEVRKQIAFQIEMEQTTPTGKLDELKKKLADFELANRPAIDAVGAAKEAVETKKKQVDGARAVLAATQQRLTDLKTNRVAHADRLLALGDLYPDSTVQLKAHVLAARYLWNEDMFERSELILRNLAGSSNRAVAAAGAVALAQAYQGKGWPRQAHQAWTAVQKNLADAMVEQADGKQATALDLAAAALASIKVTGDTSLAIDRKMPDPPYEKTWGHQHNGQYYLDMDEIDPSQFLEDHLVMLNTSTSKIVCKNVETGNDLWQLSLQRSNYSGSSTTNGRIVQFNNYTFPNGRLVRQGHIGMLTAPDRLMAFGLTSGKQLWEASALDSSARRNQGYYYGYNNNPMMPVTMGSGVVAEYGVGADRGETQVRALDAQTGKVRWLAEFKSDNIAGLCAGSDCVFVFVNNGSETIICDALTGKRTGRIRFENRQPHFPLAFTKHGLLAINMQEATLYELPSGKKKWSQPLTNKGGIVFSGYQRIDMIDDDRVCVLNGGLFVLDIKAGKVLAQSTAAELGGRYINDAAASPDGKEIVAIGYGNQGEQTINIMDTATGKVKAAINLGKRVGQQIQASKVAASGELIPVLINDPPKDMGGGRLQYTNNATIAFYRKSDGQRVDVQLPGGDAAMRVQNAQSPIVRGNVFMMLTYQNITAYRRVPGAPAQTLKPFVEPAKAPEKKDEKGAELVPGLIPLPGVPLPAVRRAILPAVKIAPKAKTDEEKKADDRKALEKKADEKKGADAGRAGKAAVVVQEGVIIVPDIILDADFELVPLPAVPAKKIEKKETPEQKKN